MRDTFLIVWNPQVDLNTLGTIAWSFWIQTEQNTPLRKMPHREVSWSRSLQSFQTFWSLSVQPSQSTVAIFLLSKTAFLIYMMRDVMRELPRSLGNDHNQPWELDTKAQPVRSFAFQAKLCHDNLTVYCHKQMVISSNRMIMPNSISNLWALPTNEAVITPSWDHYTAFFPSALFAQ